MKINIEIDCTPDEARRFLGLPDISSIQATILSRMEKRLMEAAETLDPDAMMRNWLSAFPQSPERLQDLFRSFFKPLSDGGLANKPGGQ